MTMITSRTFDKYAKIHLLVIEQGYLVWRYGTDNNVEIYDIYVQEKRQRLGTELFKKLIDELADNPPKYIFMFTKKDNIIAQKFYLKLGFEILPVFGNNFLIWRKYE